MSDNQRMNISDEAVEAAADVILRGADEGHHAYKIAYAALEAAAPYLMGTAFVRGYQSALADRSQGRSRRTPKWSRKQNPAGAGE